MIVGKRVEVINLGILGIYRGIQNKTVIIEFADFIIKTNGGNIAQPKQPN